MADEENRDQPIWFWAHSIKCWVLRAYNPNPDANGSQPYSLHSHPMPTTLSTPADTVPPDPPPTDKPSSGSLGCPAAENGRHVRTPDRSRGPPVSDASTRPTRCAARPPPDENSSRRSVGSVSVIQRAVVHFGNLGLSTIYGELFQRISGPSNKTSQLRGTTALKMTTF
ncbi:uncharacterized protein CTHT_0056190 [Thermochaetoides thermophila DSM 1495]|uniref:Uncharacterized protein n=1 Tax=Chaetomium thermophilum (strain DSM 1495 / CBS 144.50 / IMI 039719) TaxID=759272 RepID=G0SC73_CHATD|nr:hypothetical protein CTHT_0056190 [Thermochaetoides thermophila DSM 1495]EGS18999.1 hypothetical protein CTHT_0056190 [Thermochaetoides thermophila DSM 1495]